MEVLLTRQELLATIRWQKPAKAQREYSLPAEFYHKSADIIADKSKMTKGESALYELSTQSSANHYEAPE
ncbi:hypothetical protein NDU88_005494 [Pleurodeles waltl]|uniref:Uncharacterized protein n=1 Tax=Pleurodeles waltl TaxID=8319 RepID=A0AAV7PFQ4_PLEWA|nr:hypothetical protein NDU88_005494 [Pleurodeles waltl]